MEFPDLATASPPNTASQGLVPWSPRTPSSRFCSGCGRTLAQLRGSSTVGCRICYQAFADVLQQGILQLQGTTEHGHPTPTGHPPVFPMSAHPGPDWLEQLFGLGRLDWLSGKGPDADVAISSRLRLARNLNCKPFPNVACDKTLNTVFRDISSALTSRLQGWLTIPVDDLTEAEAGRLRERHLWAAGSERGLIGQGFAAVPSGFQSVTINEEDHLRFQTLESGLQLGPSLSGLCGTVRQIETELGFAVSEKLGYLTCCPSNLGTGLRASVLLHLPALAWIDALPEVARKVARIGGLTLRGLQGEESPHESSSFLQLSNQVTLGRPEHELVASVENVARSLIESERRARRRILESHRSHIEDAVWRARGLLGHARIIGLQEARDHLGLVRFGQICGLLPYPAKDSLSPIQLMVGIREAHLEAREGRSLSAQQAESSRASYLREAFP